MVGIEVIPLRRVNWLSSGIFVGALLCWNPAKAVELIMFESPICEWCEQWNEELGEIYPKTAEGKKAPLRRVDIYDPRPTELEDIKAVVFTPTFVLFDDGKEIGRIAGYPGEDFFWAMLAQMLETVSISEDTSSN